MAIAGKPQVKFTIGGKTRAGGAAPGIYRVECTDAKIDESNNKKTPYIQLELTVRKDTDHPEKEGKKLMDAKFYGANPSTSIEKQEEAKGRIRKGLFKPLNIAWPEDDADIDPRIFLKKQFFVLVAMGKANDEGESFPECKRIALKKEGLPQPKEEAAATDGEPQVDEAAKETAKPAKTAGARR